MSARRARLPGRSVVNPRIPLAPHYRYPTVVPLLQVRVETTKTQSCGPGQETIPVHVDACIYDRR